MVKTPEAQKIADAAEEKAWNEFQQQFPRADRNKFESQANFKGTSGVSTSVFGSDRRYWSPQMKTALGLDDVNGFPYQLSPLKTKKPLPIPAVNFTEAAPSVKKIFAGLVKNLRHARLFLLGEIQRNIRTNKART